MISASINANDVYAPARTVTLDLGVSEKVDVFEPYRFFSLSFKTDTAIAVQENSANLQPAFYVQGFSSAGQFNLNPGDFRTATVRYKAPAGTVEQAFNGTVSWTVGGKVILTVNLLAYCGPLHKGEDFALPDGRVEACCFKDWARKVKDHQAPSRYTPTNCYSTNNWGPNNPDRASGWRQTDISLFPDHIHFAYGVQAAETAIAINNKRSLDPRFHADYTLNVSSPAYTITPTITSLEELNGILPALDDDAAKELLAIARKKIK